MKFGLEPMRRALQRLGGLPAYPTILVAGTNGKGQVCALLSTIAHRLGYRTGLFTSPHLMDFSERIRINGCRIEEPEFYDAGWHILDSFGGTNDVKANQMRREQPDLPPVLTYFECCFAMAVDLFRRNNVNMGIFEVGLGGRLDATNVLEPSLSIITSIGMDHEQYLGNTPEAIAHEKAGIMRPGRPVIVGRQCQDVLMAEARAHGCSQMYALGRDFDWHRTRHNTVELVLPDHVLPMPGAEDLPDYQRDNAAVAFFAARIAHRIGIFTKDPFEMPSDAIRHTRWVGRMYEIPASLAHARGVNAILMDGAHNPDGVRRFCEAVADRRETRRALIVNSCEDKGMDDMFPHYLHVFEPEHIFITPANNPRLCQPDAYCARTGLDKTQACLSMAQAFERAARTVAPNGVIYVSGSLYLLGEALHFLGDTTALESTEI